MSPERVFPQFHWFSLSIYISVPPFCTHGSVSCNGKPFLLNSCFIFLGLFKQLFLYISKVTQQYQPSFFELGLPVRLHLENGILFYYVRFPNIIDRHLRIQFGYLTSWISLVGAISYSRNFKGPRQTTPWKASDGTTQLHSLCYNCKQQQLSLRLPFPNIMESNPRIDFDQIFLVRLTSMSSITRVWSVNKITENCKIPDNRLRFIAEPTPKLN